GGNYSSSQSAIIIPQPGSQTKFVIFAVSAYTNSNVVYSIVDMSLDNGLGDVIPGKKSIPVLSNTGEYIQATPSSDGTFWWVLTHKGGTSDYYTYRVTEDGVDIENPVISTTGSPSTSNGDIGFIKFNNSATRLVRTAYISHFFDISNFDNQTGIVSNALQFPLQYAYGAEFSPNERFIYVSAYGSQGVKQYDLQAGTTVQEIEATKYTFSTLSNGALLTAPDGKIYSSRHGASALDVINNPNLSAAQANYQLNALDLEGKTAQLGLINIVADFVSQAPPQLADLNVLSITEDLAQISVEINSDGGSSIIQRGFEFGMSPNALQEYLVPGGTGTMQYTFENLLPDTQYFFTAFAENQHGRTTLEVQNFTTENEVDDTPPVAICVENLTVQLSENGIAIINESMIDNGSFDDVGIESIVLNIYEFSCFDIGEQPVTLTITDTSGNVSSCTTAVFVEDITPPVIELAENQTTQFVIDSSEYYLPNYFEESIFIATDVCTNPVVNLTQFPLPGTLLTAGIHQITLTAIDFSNNSSEYAFEILIQQTLATSDYQAFEALYLYPNPASDFVTIKNPLNLEINFVEIYDLNGRLVKSINFEQVSESNTLDISDLASASYLVFIKNDRNQIYKQLIVK
ncbi:T9SS type A sorting domain-containing protein, partial [uncultured Planktosalinus sp.]|uniref:T9SS type A sorting domain-containing protein n=1 Tax=uncultured Planktosalinus sp. TaxID=1810935 RepID=UPI0030D7EBE0